MGDVVRISSVYPHHPLMRKATVNPARFLEWFYSLGYADERLDDLGETIREHLESSYSGDDSRAKAVAEMMIEAEEEGTHRSPRPNW